jgi:hypothetical protein
VQNVQKQVRTVLITAKKYNQRNIVLSLLSAFWYYLLVKFNRIFKRPVTFPEGEMPLMKDRDLQAEIEKVAYELHEKRGMIHGHDLADWLEAERSVLEKYAREIGKEIGKTSKRKKEK